MAYEEANYEVVKQNKIYEIRKYSDRLAIETITSNQGSSFRKLFNYISGNNESKEEISMTTPVTQIEKKEGIILSSVIVINSAPTLNSTELFTLHSGSKVEITDRIGDWLYIKITNGNSGWLLQNSVKEL